MHRVGPGPVQEDVVMDDPAETLAAIETHFSDALNDWEGTFVASLAERLDAGRTLTTRQLEKLDEVFERVSGGGRNGGRSR
jgi:hypothetical protein